MKGIPRYITSIQIQAIEENYVKISLGFEKNGTIRLNIQDTSRLDQDSRYMSEAAYPNSGVIAHGKYELWLSMFTRLLRPIVYDDQMP